MKIIQLEYFLAIVKYNNFTQAAQFLHISQPSLTATIKKMETDLGYDLFTRTTKDIKITEKGIQFYNYAVDLVQNYHQTMEKMHDLNISEMPKIKFSILESTNQWVSQIITNHRSIFPNQTYQISEVHDQAIILEHLLNFETHLALTNEHITHEDIQSIPLYEESYVLLTPQNAFKQQRTIIIKSLPLILPSKGLQVRKHLDDYFMRMNIHPNIVIEADRFEAATNFVHRGLGYAVIPRFYYQSFNANNLDAIEIKPKLGRTIYINYYKKRKHPERVLSLVDLCKDYWNVIK